MDRFQKKSFLMTGAAVLTGTLLFCSGMTVGAATNEPGSAGDPLITRSYLEAELEGFTGGFECITLSKGETMTVKQGTQLILYTGTAKIVGSMIDTTDGNLVGNGTKTVKYHTYLAPADESGFTADTTCVIFLAGAKK